MINPLVLGLTGGVGATLGASKIYKKTTGKPFGAPASTTHIITNDKLDSKLATSKDILKETAKDTLNVGRVALSAAGGAAIATGCFDKAAKAFDVCKSTVGEILSKFSFGEKNLKDIIKNNKFFKKFATLPTPAKAAIAVGASVLALLLPVSMLSSAQKSGYIEGQHEVK